MGYLNNATTTVDAILTKKGREILAKGNGFNVTKFAVADDEVDYSLYTTSHPLGTNFYGAIIENMPVIEAVPDESQVMRYKLVTLPPGTSVIPIISVGSQAYVLVGATGNQVITPTTTRGLNGANFGYTAILANSDAATLTGQGLENLSPTTPSFLSDAESATATVAVGTSFNLLAKDVATAITTQITFIGNQTGASVTVPLTVNVAATT